MPDDAPLTYRVSWKGVCGDDQVVPVELTVAVCRLKRTMCDVMLLEPSLTPALSSTRTSRLQGRNAGVLARPRSARGLAVTTEADSHLVVPVVPFPSPVGSRKMTWAAETAPWTSRL